MLDVVTRRASRDWTAPAARKESICFEEALLRSAGRLTSSYALNQGLDVLERNFSCQSYCLGSEDDRNW